MLLHEGVSRLQPYVPRVSTEWDAVAKDSLWRAVDGSLVFVDISGFTNLSEHLARKGRIGAEELTAVLDRVFGHMLEAAFARGGSLLKFGGDALLLLFETDDHVMQAAAATVEMRAALREASKQPTSVGRIKLGMSSGIHTGRVDFFLVGDSHRELIVTGPTATVTTDMEGTADAGEILVSPEVKAALPNSFTGHAKGDGWLLRKQKIDHPPSGPIARPALPDTVLAAMVPRGLREQLASGVTDSEHRLATIGFVKFKGIEALLAEGGPERVGKELDRLVTAVQTAADAENITFLASDIDADGGKIILSAGVPVSQHDDEGRMLRAARRILSSDVGLPIRVGVNRGHVFAGNVGTSFRRTYTVMGDTVNLAARLMAAASPGELYAAPSVVNLSSTLFRTAELEPFAVKGKTELVYALEVFEETGQRPPETVHELPYGGREDEVAAVVELLAAAESGSGGVITVTGDTGIGKSRLVAEGLARGPATTVLRVQGEPNGADNPYWAFRDSLRHLAGIDRVSQQDMARKLASTVGRVASELEPMLPLLADVFHIDVGDTAATAAIDPQFRPDRTADVVIALLAALAPGTLAVVAEDAHWMDEASLALLQRLATAAAALPWALVMTARHDGGQVATLGEEIALGPLPAEAVRSILIEATRTAPLRPHEIDRIVTHAGGNPLFLTEIVKVVKETGRADELPESLDAVVSNEIDTLAPVPRQLLRYASVLGRSFRRQVLDQLLEPDGITLDAATRRELAPFLDADGATRLRFHHSVVHEVAYEGLSYRRRRELHARAGTVIEHLAGEDPEAVAEFLVDHFAVSGNHPKAWHYALIAAERARKAYSNVDAANHYRRALEAAAHLDDVASAEVADTWTSLGEVQHLAGHYEEARHAYGRAAREVKGEPVRLAELYLKRAESWFRSGAMTQAKRNITLGRNQLGAGGDRQLARLAAYEASVHAETGNPAAAMAAATAAAEMAGRVGEDEALARAYGILDWANFALGRDEPRHGGAAIDILQRLGFLERSAGIINNMGAFAYLEGKWDEAIEWYQQGVETSERCGNVVRAALTRANIAEVLVSQRRAAEALPLIEEAERTATASNAAWILPFVGLQAARAAIALGEFDQAVDALEGICGRQLEEGKALDEPEPAIELAAALVGAHRPDEALRRLAQLESGSPAAAGQAAVARVRAQALDDAGRSQDAQEARKVGLAAAVDGGNRYEEALLLDGMVAARVRVGVAPDPEHLARRTELFGLLGIAS